MGLVSKRRFSINRERAVVTTCRNLRGKARKTLVGKVIEEKLQQSERPLADSVVPTSQQARDAENSRRT